MTSPSLDPWHDFRAATAARIALGRSGGSLPTRELLSFGLAHARARDAVIRVFNPKFMVDQLGLCGLDAMVLSSATSNRDEYLRRPDLGRRLSDESRKDLSNQSISGCDLCLIISDGLSSSATSHAAKVAQGLLTQLQAEQWKVAPVMVVPFARVAIQDEIGERIGAAISLILLGERPGLGSPDSLGAYFVHGPRVGKSDADRNCVSNIRPQGLPLADAVATLHYLLNCSRRRKLSGISLKDERLITRESSPSGLPGTATTPE